MQTNIRDQALRTLSTNEGASDLSIHNAIIDLRRNAERGDERVLRPFLDHNDPMVVAATLYTLVEVHDLQEELRPLLEKVIRGDVRECDDLDKSIQCMAIALMASIGEQEQAAVDIVREIAEDDSTSVDPRTCAWERLADLYKAEWPNNATEEMMLYPQSVESERIRASIRKAIATHDSGSGQ